jgi:predicted nuclease of predicted toxin-antitoxin system
MNERAVRFKCDENMPAEAARVLMLAGFDTSTVLVQRLAGAPDEIVAEVCRSESRVLLTLDLDFADIRGYPPDKHPGIIVLRPDNQDIQSIVRLCESAVSVLDREEIGGRLWIVEDRGIRVRGG